MRASRPRSFSLGAFVPWWQIFSPLESTVPFITNVLERRRGSWLEIFADGGSIRLPLELAPSGIARGDTLSDEQWAALVALSEFQVLYDIALRLLGRREHFVMELRRKLALRSMDKPLIARVIAACRERGYVDDARAAEYITTLLINRGGIGKARLKTELLSRGAGKELAEATIEAHAGELDEAQAVADLLAYRRAYFANKRDSLRRKLEEKEGQNMRKVKMLLRDKLGLAVGNFIFARGFTDEDARKAARKLVEELLEEDGTDE
jgi:SOS response regulatory protein OraA/RecX